jgi:hypothetical protein
MRIFRLSLGGKHQVVGSSRRPRRIGAIDQRQASLVRVIVSIAICDWIPVALVYRHPQGSQIHFHGNKGNHYGIHRHRFVVSARTAKSQREDGTLGFAPSCRR